MSGVFLARIRAGGEKNAKKSIAGLVIFCECSYSVFQQMKVRWDHDKKCNDPQIAPDQ